MSELDDAIEQHMAYIVLSIGRPFSFKDFLCFEVDGEEYKASHGTVRNKFNEFTEKEIIELDYKTNIAFYTLKGHKFGKKLMTPNHTGVSHNHPVYKLLENLVLDKQSFQNIRLTFKVPNIYRTFSVNTTFSVNPRNWDIQIPSWNKNNAIVRVMIHKTNTVSVAIACSREPFTLDPYGINDFTNLLVRIEERLQSILDNSNMINVKEKYDAIPDYGKWLMTMWHLNRDALQEYMGKGISITVENAQHIIYRIYSKQVDKHKHMRIEKQEYRRMTVEELIEETL